MSVDLQPVSNLFRARIHRNLLAMAMYVAMLNEGLYNEIHVIRFVKRPPNKHP